MALSLGEQRLQFCFRSDATLAKAKVSSLAAEPARRLVPAALVDAPGDLADGATAYLAGGRDLEKPPDAGPHAESYPAVVRRMGWSCTVAGAAGSAGSHEAQ